MLAIEVEYLLGKAYAAEFRDGSRPEWPPNPARLFSALVAAHHDQNGTEKEREALLWLESQAPPEIAAGTPGEANEVVGFVPTNYAGKSGSSHPEHRTKQGRSFPAQAPSSPIVRFVWPDADAKTEHVDGLRELASRVASLGRACSLIRMRVMEAVDSSEPSRPNYVPATEGSLVFAQVSRGRLTELERSFSAGRRPQQGTPVRYSKVEGGTVTPKAQGHFGEMIVLRRVGGTVFPIESTAVLTRYLRKAFLSHAGQGEELSAALSGHDGKQPTTEPHVAFGALPHVGGEFGDGRLMGLCVMLPRALSKPDRRIALRACASIDSVNLGDLGEWRVEIANFDVMQKTLKAETWMRAGKTWTSVTPIVLDRFPKKGLATEELLVMACLRAGLPTPAKCVFGAYAQGPRLATKGIAPVFAFSGKRWAVHASFEFKEDVKGPIVVGAGRFFGMGLLKPFFQAEAGDVE